MGRRQHLRPHLGGIPFLACVVDAWSRRGVRGCHNRDPLGVRDEILAAGPRARNGDYDPDGRVANERGHAGLVADPRH
jgi:hypothetical protein